MLPLLGKCKLTNKEHGKKIPPCLALGSFLMGACCVLSAIPETRQVPGDAGSPLPGDAVARGFAETLGKARPSSYPGCGVQSVISRFLPSS